MRRDEVAPGWDDGQVDLFEEDGIIAAASAYYTEDGERWGAVEVHLLRRGPRGGEYTQFKGSPEEARRRARLLIRAADRAEDAMPKRAGWAP